MSRKSPEGGRGRKIVVIDDQIGREGPFRKSFLAKAGCGADDFVFMTGQNESGRNDPVATVRRVESLWGGAGGDVSLVLLDVRFDDPEDPDGERFGFRLLDALRERCGQCLPIVMLTGEPHTRQAANEHRADGFVPKSGLDPETLSSQLFRNGLYPDDQFGLLGGATAFLLALREIRRAAASGAMELLLLGETGSGKSELARYAHDVSRRRKGPFKTWFARAENAELHYDQLFGHWKGAFSGADRNMAGVAEQAHLGTLFIDEIAELSAVGQAELLEYRDRGQDDDLRRVRRLGLHPGAAAKDLNLVGKYSPGEDRILVDTVLITATNQPIQDASWRDTRAFRQDLYNRLGHRVGVPSLRSRREDIELLFRHFLRRSAGRPIDVADAARDRLLAHSWAEGNVAELKVVADGVCMRLGPDFNDVQPHHLEGLIADPGSSVPGRSPAGATARPLSFVDYEVESLWGLAERLRTAVIETRTAHGAGTLSDILRYATGVTYAPTDVKREVKEMLAVWFAPNDRRAARWRGHRTYQEHAERVRGDAVLAALYEYSAGQAPWADVRERLGAASQK